MKRNLKDQIRDLLSVKGKKPYMLVANKREPGIYDCEGKKYTESEFEILKENYRNVIVFVAHGCGELSSDSKNLNIMVDSPATAETFLKLRKEFENEK
jgi:hypothetical protein